WLIFILDMISPNVVEIWEAVVTFIFFPLLVFIAYAADVGWIGGGDSLRGRGTVITADMSPEELKDLEEDIRRRHGNSITREQVAQIMEIECSEPSSIATYRRRKHHKPKGKEGSIPPTKIVPITEDEEQGK
ncbi:SLC8A1, partial [Symbiodinium natans]